MLFLLARTIASMGAREGNNAPAAAMPPVLTVQVTTPQARQRREEILANGSIVAWHDGVAEAELSEGAAALVEAEAMLTLTPHDK